MSAAPCISHEEGPLAGLLGVIHDPLAFLRAAGLRHPLLRAAGRDALDVVEGVARTARAFREPSVAAPPGPGDLVILRSRVVYVVLAAVSLPGRVVLRDGAGTPRSWRSGGGAAVIEECPHTGGWGDPVRVESVVDLEALLGAR